MNNFQIQRQAQINDLGIIAVLIRVPFKNGTFSKTYIGHGMTIAEATQVAINKHTVTGNEIER